MTKTKIDLRTKTTDELVELLKTLPRDECSEPIHESRFDDRDREVDARWAERLRAVPLLTLTPREVALYRPVIDAVREAHDRGEALPELVRVAFTEARAKVSR